MRLHILPPFCPDDNCVFRQHVNLSVPLDHGVDQRLDVLDLTGVCGLANASPPAASISSVTAVRGSILREASTTLAPAAAYVRAISAPMPWLAPVTIATLSFMMVIMAQDCIFGFADTHGLSSPEPGPDEIPERYGQSFIQSHVSTAPRSAAGPATRAFWS